MKAEKKQEVEEAFATMKNEFGLAKDFLDYEQIFFLYDMAEQDGFIAEIFHRQVSSRIANTFNSWYMHLHSIILPNQGSMVSLTESHMFTDDEKNKLSLLMNKIIYYISNNTVIALTKDKQAQKEFLDGSIDFWNEIKPELLSMAEKVRQGWKGYSEE